MKQRRDRSVVLLSGGMDSATALFWALENSDVLAVINFTYGQQGACYERRQACRLHGYVRGQKGTEGARKILFVAQALHLHTQSTLMGTGPSSGSTTRPDGLPLTFVPARNLIFIAIAAGIAYDLDANAIVGGFSQVDVDYPDCKVRFLRAAEEATRLAFGQEAAALDGLKIRAPLALKSKVDTVQLGERLGVPWGLTRSCYGDEEAPCLVCDSCVLRASAFLAAGVRDPLIPIDQWDMMDELYQEDKRRAE